MTTDKPIIHNNALEQYQIISIEIIRQWICNLDKVQKMI